MENTVAIVIEHQFNGSNQATLNNDNLNNIVNGEGLKSREFLALAIPPTTQSATTLSINGQNIDQFIERNPKLLERLRRAIEAEIGKEKTVLEENNDLYLRGVAYSNLSDKLKRRESFFLNLWDIITKSKTYITRNIRKPLTDLIDYDNKYLIQQEKINGLNNGLNILSVIQNQQQQVFNDEIGQKLALAPLSFGEKSIKAELDKFSPTELKNLVHLIKTSPSSLTADDNNLAAVILLSNLTLPLETIAVVMLETEPTPEAIIRKFMQDDFALWESPEWGGKAHHAEPRYDAIVLPRMKPEDLERLRLAGQHLGYQPFIAMTNTLVAGCSIVRLKLYPTTDITDLLPPVYSVFNGNAGPNTSMPNAPQPNTTINS